MDWERLEPSTPFTPLAPGDAASCTRVLADPKLEAVYVHLRPERIKRPAFLRPQQNRSYAVLVVDDDRLGHQRRMHCEAPDSQEEREGNGNRHCKKLSVASIQILPVDDLPIPTSS